MNLPRQVDLMCIAEVRTGRDELHQLAPAFSLLLSVLRWLSAREPTDELGRGNHRKSPLSCSPVSFSGNNRRRAQPPPPRGTLREAFGHQRRRDVLANEVFG